MLTYSKPPLGALRFASAARAPLNILARRRKWGLNYSGVIPTPGSKFYALPTWAALFACLRGDSR